MMMMMMKMKKGVMVMMMMMMMTRTHADEGEEGDDPFKIIRPFKWRNLGVCSYCSVNMGCCGTMLYGVENGTVGKEYYVNDRLDCSTDNIMKYNYSERTRRVDWCYKWCRFCYQDPEMVDMTFLASASYKKDNFALVYLLGLVWTIVFVVVITALQLVSRRVTWIRKYMLLPVFEMYLQIYLVINIGLLLLLTLTDTSEVDNQPDRMCCTQKLAFRLIVLSMWAQFDGLLPLFLLLQQTFTKRSLCKTFTESFVISAIVPIIAFSALVIPFAVFDVRRQYFQDSVTAMFTIAMCYGFFLCVWLVWRIYWTRRNKCNKKGCFQLNGTWREILTSEIQKKRHFWYYALPFILYILSNASMQNSLSDTYKVRLTLLMIWNFVRIPLVYTCLYFETMFWVQGAKNTESMSRQVVGEMQHFLHERKKIMIDYFDLDFGPKIGEGATAEVFRGRYKDRDVAIKVYTPKTITVNLLNEFAEEIDLMRKLRHPSVANIIGLSVMVRDLSSLSLSLFVCLQLTHHAHTHTHTHTYIHTYIHTQPPNIVVVLPLYRGGNLPRRKLEGVLEDASSQRHDFFFFFFFK